MGLGGLPVVPVVVRGPHGVVADHGSMAVGAYQVTRPVVAARPVRLTARPAHLAGRVELLGVVNERLRRAGGASGVGLVALHGLGGVGKTSVAVEYAHRHQGEYGLVWQMEAEDPATLTARFAELAAVLGAREVVDAADPVQQVHAVLAARTDRWLLVLDNVVDERAIRQVVPPAGQGDVLVTTRSPAWPEGVGVEVPVLTADAAARFLLERTGQSDRAAAELVAAELGELPLALEQAAAYMLAAGKTLREYATLLADQRALMLRRGDPVGYDQRVASTWSLTFKALEQSAPEAITLLRLMACYAPDAIPLDMLLIPGTSARLPTGEGRRESSGEDAWVKAELTALIEGPLGCDDAVMTLRRYSLISPPARGRVSVHRLVQAVTLDNLTPAQQLAWRRAAAVLLETAMPPEPAERQNWRACAALVSHARAVLAPGSPALAAIVEYLAASGDYRTGLTLQHHIHHHRDATLGPDHPDTLTARSDLAELTGDAGDAAAARDQLTMLLPAIERVLGAEHPKTLIARTRLAVWTGEAGDAAAARDQFTDLIPTLELVLGGEHRRTLVVRADRAYFTGQAGDVAEARDRFASLIPVMQQALAVDDPETLNARANLAYFTGAAGDPAGARDQFAELLPIWERVLGAEHPKTLVARASVGLWTGKAGDPVRARDLFTELLPVVERVLGPHHPETLIDRGNLANWTGEAGDAAAARDQYADLVPVWGRVAGPDHPHTLRERSQLADWTGRAGNPAAARDQHTELVAIRQRTSGPDHPRTLQARIDLAWWTGMAGDPAAARDQYTELLPLLDPNDPDTLIDYAHLADWTGEAGDASQARDQYARLLPQIEQMLGPDHRRTLRARADLARWTAEIGDAADAAAARDRFAELLAVREQTLGPDHYLTLNTRADLARWTGRAGDAASARDQYADLLPVRERVSGPDHPDTQDARTELAYWQQQTSE